MMSRPQVSVVLPTFNREQTVGRAIHSVLGQSFTDLELLVVDDGSTDATAARVSEFADHRLRYIRLPQNAGVSAARNAGAAQARGEWLAFQDSDDEWHLDKLQQQLACAEHDIGLILCGDRVINNPTASYPLRPLPAPCVDIGPDLYRCIPPAPCFLLRRELFNSSGGFDERLNCFEDWELALRIAPSTRIVMLHRALVFRERTPGSLFSQEVNYAWNLQIILDRHAQALQKHPQAWAYYQNLLGQQLCQSGRASQGRAHFARAWRANPVSPRAWMNWLASWMGARIFCGYVQFARWLKRGYIVWTGGRRERAAR